MNTRQKLINKITRADTKRSLVKQARTERVYYKEESEKSTFLELRKCNRLWFKGKSNKEIREYLE